MILTIRQERISRDWTLEYVGRQVGLMKSTVQQIETGQRKPSHEVLLKLLELFEYSDPRELFAPVAAEEETA